MIPEWLVAENVLETLWLRLKRLTSITLCRKIIERKFPSLSPEISEKKASDMAWTVRSALGYWETKSGGLNSRILSRYYALLQFSMTEQIGSINPADNLPSIQRHTESGHGLFTITDNGTSSFPSSYFIGCLRSGHYYEYCKHLGIDLSQLIFDRRPHDPIFNIDHFTGAFVHPIGHWGSFLKPYKSGYSGTSLVAPFWGINDPFLLHLTVLYGFSIIVRYLPDLWHRIEDGDLDHIRAFLEHYLVIVDNVLPKIIVERLTGIPLMITQPGSLRSQV